MGALRARELLPLLVNDLEPAAFSLRAGLDELRCGAERLAGRAVRMSGSGSSLFTLFDEEPEAREAAGRVEAALGVRVEAVGVAPVIDDDLGT